MSTANRLLNVLGLFTLDRPQWTVEAAALELGLTLSTTYRYFKSLVEAGLVAADTPRHYTLGPAIIHFDRQMRLRDPLISTAAPVMQRLARTIDPEAVVLLCRLYRHQVVCVHQETMSTQDFHARWERGQPISYERGQPMPLHRGAPSKAILAHMKSRAVRAVYDSDPDAMREVGLGATWAEVKRNLRELRANRAIVTKGELEGGMQGVAAPILSAQTGAIGSLSIVLPRGEPTMSLDRVMTMLAQAAHEIEAGIAPKRVGGRTPARPEPLHAAPEALG